MHDFYLVGGTALSLYLGHRISVDLDFFTSNDFYTEPIIEDIIPMKLSAVANRGAKKDFFDIFELMKKYSLKQMMLFFSKKFPETEHFQILKSLTFFDDAENDFNPISLNNTTWEQVKTEIEKQVKLFL